MSNVSIHHYIVLFDYRNTTDMIIILIVFINTLVCTCMLWLIAMVLLTLDNVSA